MSRNNIVVRTLGAAAALTLGYFALVQTYHPLFRKAASLDLNNRLSLENYVYGGGAPVILVGSSLTQSKPATEVRASSESLRKGR